MSSVIVQVYPSFFTNESRILRESTAIVELGIASQVILVGLWRDGLLQEECLSEKIRLIRVKGPFRKKVNSSWKNILVLFFLFLRLVKITTHTKAAALSVHSLTMLPFGVLTAWFLGCRLIYDAHELETETHASRGLRKILAKGIEWVFIRFADHTVVVSHSIESWYRQRYKIKNISTIKNTPALMQHVPARDLKSKLQIDESSLLFVYVGLLSGGRGIERIIDSFTNEELKDRHVVFIGYGDMEHVVKKSIRSNIHFLPAVPPDEVTSYVAGADVGLSLIEATCLSYYYSLPNKVFEYLSAGIPFISSDFPDVRMEFEKFEVCWFSGEQIPLETLLSSISREELMLRRTNVARHRAKWDWNLEKLKLAHVYKSIKSQ